MKLKRGTVDEARVLRDTNSKYSLANGSVPINYAEWLIITNNFGILDTQESFILRVPTKGSEERSTHGANKVWTVDLQNRRSKVW